MIPIPGTRSKGATVLGARRPGRPGPFGVRPHPDDDQEDDVNQREHTAIVDSYGIVIQPLRTPAVPGWWDETEDVLREEQERDDQDDGDEEHPR
ncbi:hypothetical protein [Streptomyces racemochromogenes]|uniref:hypothetical protein n=1 Tax=Streptomyces racemochromogenes TaxID=67353 RepID=UPI0031E73C4D